MRAVPGGGKGRSEDRRLYGISEAAGLVGTGEQNLRAYERRGLLSPARTGGGTRRYSEADLLVLRRIAVLLSEGLNLAGISAVLRLEADNLRLREQLRQARAWPATDTSPEQGRPHGEGD